MITKLFSSKARVEILKLLLFNSDNTYYQRQISLLTNLPIRAVQRELKKLKEISLIEEKIEGNRVYYKTNRKCPIFKELKSIFLKTVGISQSLKKYLKKIKNSIEIAFIYGSYAKQTESISSDIDLFVIGNITLKQLSALLSKPKDEIGREINYNVYSQKEFRERIKRKDSFLTNLVNQPKIFLIGEKDALKKIIE